ncbi:hypothetical protein LUR56_18495 [Streptomyces sp. MT29]|nr:hypothetical protein [Streptomyces sp. MT29]
MLRYCPPGSSFPGSAGATPTDAFQHATVDVVEFPDPLRGGTSTNTIHVSITGSAGSAPELKSAAGQACTQVSTALRG